MTTRRNPYELADEALAAYRDQDPAAWRDLTGDADASREHVEALSGARIDGLYFQDGGRQIAAVLDGVTAPAAASLAAWFLIRRTDDGFQLLGLRTGETPPDRSVPVEG